MANEAGGSPSNTQTGANPQGAAPSTPTSGAEAGGQARNWEHDYTDLETRYRDLESRSKRYEEFGDPDQVRQTISWAQQAARAMNEGRLIDKSTIERETPTQPAADLFANWDEMTPKEQAALLRSSVSGELGNSIQQEWGSVKRQFEDFQKQQGMQLQLAIQAMRKSQESGVPFDQLVQEATALSQLPPHELLERALNALVSPQKQKEEIERQVNERLAAERQKFENERAQQLYPSLRAPRFLSRDRGGEGKTPRERMDEARERILRDASKIRQAG